MGSDNDRPDKDGDADEDQLQLSAETFSALQAFYKEQESREIAMAGLRSNSTDQQQQQQQLDEDWQLSQFWYDDQTAETLANEVVRAADSVASSASAPADDRGTKVAIACVSCPTLYLAIKRLFPDLVHEVRLFEFDKRFATLAGQRQQDFVFYDYRNPMELGAVDHLDGADLRDRFDVVIADPPFLSEECLTKVAVTVKYISKSSMKAHHILCTGATMEELAGRLLQLKVCRFKPKHKNNLANEFACFANYDLDANIAAVQK